MKLSRRHRQHNVGFDMTPMIDIVFLLLIFFMTVTQQSQVEKERVELPKQAGSDEQVPVTLTLNITRDDRLVRSGVRINLEQLDSMIREELRRVGNNPALLETTLRVDQRADSALVNQVMLRLKKAGATRTRIAVEVPGG